MSGALLARTLLIGVLFLLAVAPPVSVEAQAPVLRLAINREEGSLNPYTFQTGYPGWVLMNLVYDTLYYTDADNVPQPLMVRDTRVSADGRTWTLTLRPDLRWHDDRPLTSSDVKFTFEYVRQFTHGRWTPQVREIESIETPDALTVVFRLSRPVAGFLTNPLADLPILPRHIWEGVTEPRRFTNTVGSGPYRIAEIRAGEFYRLVANDRHFTGPPKLREILLPIIRDATVDFTSLRAGSTDASARSLPPELVAQFSGTRNLKVVRGPGFASTLLQFNNEHPLLSDVRLRRAIALAIDTTAMVRLLMLGHAVVGSPGYLHPASPWHNPAASITPSRSEAVAILDAAGYLDRDRDGIREAPDGTPLRFTLMAQSGNPIRVRGADLIRTWLRPVGIDVTVRALEDASIIDLVWQEFDACRARRYDMTMFGWSAPVMLRPTALRDLFHSDCRLGTINIGGYRNAEIDALGERLAAAVDLTEQRRIAFEMQAIVARDLPVHVLFYADGIFAYRSNVFDGWVFQKGQGIVNRLSFANPPPR